MKKAELSRPSIVPGRSARLAAGLLVLLLAGTAAYAAPAPLTTLRAIHHLDNAEAAQKIPVAFEATVTYFRSYTRELFVQDGDAAIFVYLTRDFPLHPGDRIFVRGITQPSFRPIVESNDVRVLRHAELPKPIPSHYQQLALVQRDGQRVKVRAAVQSADVIVTRNVPSTYIHMTSEGGALDLSVETGDPGNLADLLDAEVEVTGVSAAMFDSKMQQTGTMLHANSMDDVKIVKRSSTDPWKLPVTQMDEIFPRYTGEDHSARIRVHGTITFDQPGAGVVLQDGAKSLWIDTATSDTFQVGDLADATGFPQIREGFLELVHAEVMDRHVRAPITPQPATWQSLSLSNNIQLGHVYDLVSIEGQVVTEAREAAQDEYVLAYEGQLFSAVYRHSDTTSLIPLPPMKEVPVGSRIRVTGICYQLSSNPWNGPVAFNILLRSSDDITVLAAPSWLNVSNLIKMVSLMFILAVAAGTWGTLLRRKVRQQTAALATRIEAEAILERRRSSILEDINGKTPLPDILAQIASLVSFHLGGAYCWLQIGAGAPIGDCPANQEGLELQQQEIRSRSGPLHGTIHCAREICTAPCGNISDALSMGAWLATLAIETRGLYSDLVHRSEFDLLTDIHNRFSLENRLDKLIVEAGSQGGSFGLIYIDLDEFKQVNDQYGHRVGDLYLQEVAQRMKEQMRPGDLLARLGGDEFAALIPCVHKVSDIEEITARLEHCFDEPFLLEECALQGSASLGFALYPEDGTTGDGLLRTADAAMYKMKHNQRRRRKNAGAAVGVASHA